MTSEDSANQIQNSPVDKTENGLSLRNNVIWNSVGSLFYSMVNWIITVLVVLLSPDYSNSGTLAIAMAVGNVFGIIMRFKVRSVQVSDLKPVYAPSDYIGSRFITLIMATIFTLFYSMGTVALHDYLPVFMYLLLVAVESFVDVYHGINQQHNRMDYVGISLLIRGIGILTCFIAGMVVWKSLTVALLLMAVVSFLIILLYDVPRTRKFEKLTPHFDFSQQINLLRTCFPGFTAFLLCTLVISLSRQFYGIDYGNEMLGIYAAVATPTVIVQALAGYVYAPLLGPIAIAWEDKDFISLLKLIKRFVLMLSVLIIGAAAIFAFFGDNLLQMIYGSTIAGYADLMLPILAATSIITLYFFALDFLIVIRNYVSIIVSSAAALIVCLLSVRYLLTTYNMNGINLTIILSFVVGIFISIAFAVNQAKNTSDS